MKTKVNLVIGAPGTGKGTQCKLASRVSGMIHISTGDLCRDIIMQHPETPLGQQVSAYINANSLVPDEILDTLLHERLLREDARKYGVLLDGYPRTLPQAQALMRHRDFEVERIILLQSRRRVWSRLSRTLIASP